MLLTKAKNLSSPLNRYLSQDAAVLAEVGGMETVSSANTLQELSRVTQSQATLYPDPRIQTVVTQANDVAFPAIPDLPPAYEDAIQQLEALPKPPEVILSTDETDNRRKVRA